MLDQISDAKQVRFGQYLDGRPSWKTHALVVLIPLACAWWQYIARAFEFWLQYKTKILARAVMFFPRKRGW